MHNRQLLKMLRRDTVVGHGHDIQGCFAMPTFIVTYTYYVHSNDIENYHIVTLSNTHSLLTITQLISTIGYTCILLTYMHDQASLLPKEIKSLTCNKSWPEHCISRCKTAVSGWGLLFQCNHDNR